MTKDEQIIRNQDFSFTAATAADHIVELYNAAIENSSKKILELGSYKGHSGIALALAAKRNNGFFCSVDLCDEISQEDRINYWINCEESIIEYIFPVSAAATPYLSGEDIPEYDFIFQDAGHGDCMLPELYLCWSKTQKGGIFAMHDFDVITDQQGFIKNLNPRKYIVSKDNIGRELAIFYK